MSEFAKANTATIESNKGLENIFETKIVCDKLNAKCDKQFGCPNRTDENVDRYLLL